MHDPDVALWFTRHTRQGARRAEKGNWSRPPA
jgi:hypothetical protein